MARRSFSIAAWAVLPVAGCLALVGCSGAQQSGNAESSAPPTRQDAAVLVQLAEVATRDAEIDGAPRGVECWAPTENRLDGEASSGSTENSTGDSTSASDGDEGFRVLCRVHYEQQGESRYRDMICIGYLARDPVAESCYQWAFYTDMPEFEDRPAYFAADAD